MDVAPWCFKWMFGWIRLDWIFLGGVEMAMLMLTTLLMTNMMIMTICLFLQVGRPHGNLVFFKPPSFPRPEHTINVEHVI